MVPKSRFGMASTVAEKPVTRGTPTGRTTPNGACDPTGLWHAIAASIGILSFGWHICEGVSEQGYKLQLEETRLYTAIP